MERRELGRNQNQQRESFALIWQLGRNDADGLERDDFTKGQLESARVFTLCRIEAQIAAAFDYAGIKRKADTARRFERHIEIDRAEVALTELNC